MLMITVPNRLPGREWKGRDRVSSQEMKTTFTGQEPTHRYGTDHQLLRDGRKSDREIFVDPENRRMKIGPISRSITEVIIYICER